MKHRNVHSIVSRLIFLLLAPGALLLAPRSLLAQNSNCTIIVPTAPLTATGLSTPYQLLPTNTADGPCDEANAASSAFVQAGVFDPATGQISIYNPLVITQGTAPAVQPVVPVLPDNAIVAIWFGFDGNTLTLQGADPSTLSDNNCVNGLSGGNNFGQFAYCNAPAFFKAANRAIRRGQLHVPRLGRAADGLPCPTVRDFYVIDQDQSDNLPVTYLVLNDALAQKTQINIGSLTGAQTLGNPSDNGLLDRFLDVSLNCTPWKAPDLADPGQNVPALPLNELQARVHQRAPVALIPAGDPMAVDGDGTHDLSKVNAYRRGVDQPVAGYNWQADTARYCRHMIRIAPFRLLFDKALLIPDTAHPTRGVSPDPGAADSLFTFMAQRFVASYQLLGCGDLVRLKNPITVTTDANGIAIGATIDLPYYNRCRHYLAPWERQDDSIDNDEAPAATE